MVDQQDFVEEVGGVLAAATDYSCRFGLEVALVRWLLEVSGLDVEGEGLREELGKLADLLSHLNSHHIVSKSNFGYRIGCRQRC